MADGGHLGQKRPEDGVASTAGKWIPIVPPPETAGNPVFCDPVPSKIWPYHNKNGELEGYVARFDVQTAEGTPDKTFRPIRYGQHGDVADWHFKGWGDDRPPYRLTELMASPTVRIIVCEGEKAADQAAVRFPDCIATTSMNGAQSPEKTDWSWASGRAVTIWGDNDEPGRRYATAVVGHLAAAGAASIRVVDVPEDWPSGWDLADAAPDGVSADDLRQLLDDAPLVDGEEQEDDSKQRNWPFRLADTGVERRSKDGDDWSFVCSCLEISAVTRDSNSQAWGRLLVVTDRDGNRHEWAMPTNLLAGDGSNYRQELLSMGLEIAPGKSAREALHEYIATARPSKKARCVARTGWHETPKGGNVFVLPDATFGDTGKEDVLLQTSGGGAHGFHCAGNLEEWRNNIGRLCVGNSRLVLAVSAAFSAPLLKIVGEESGGINFQGQSRTGNLRHCGSPARFGAAAALTDISSRGVPLPTGLRASPRLTATPLYVSTKWDK